MEALIPEKYTLLLGVFMVFALALYISYRIYPVILSIAYKKGLVATPVDRSSHKKETPNLGGIGLFISFLVSISLAGAFFKFTGVELSHLLAIISSVTILFSLGILDDLVGVTPLKKMSSQFLAAVVVILMANMKIDNLYGVFGLELLPYWLSFVVSVFAFIFLINAFNLIDGIDGLAGSQGIIICFSLSVFFILSNNLFLSLISVTLTASFVGFLIFNLSNRKKIFMGDSGSLFIGFLMLTLVFSFLHVDIGALQAYTPNKLIFAFTLFAFPILDTTRVFFLRVIKGQSPFTADKNHLHHKLLELGLSHKKATLLIALLSVFVICFSLLFKDINPSYQFVASATIACVVFYTPSLLTRKSITKTKKSSSAQNYLL